MSSIVAGVVGPGVSADGSNPELRLGRSGEQIVTQLHGRYFEQSKRSGIFIASNAASTSSAGLATTYTGGVCISNPAGSLVNLSILKASLAMTVISTAVTAGGLIAGWLGTGVTAHTTPLVPVSTLIGSSSPPVAKADQAATLVGTPFWVFPGLGSTGIAAGVFGVTIDLEGSIVIPPGGYIATGTSVASAAAAMICSIMWEEILITG